MRKLVPQKTMFHSKSSEFTKPVLFKKNRIFQFPIKKLQWMSLEKLQWKLISNLQQIERSKQVFRRLEIWRILETGVYLRVEKKNNFIDLSKRLRMMRRISILSRCSRSCTIMIKNVKEIIDILKNYFWYS